MNNGRQGANVARCADYMHAFTFVEITVTSSYKDGATLISGVSINFEAFLKHFNLSGISENLKNELKSTLTISEFDELLTRFPEESEKLEPLKKYFFKSSTWNTFCSRTKQLLTKHNSC